MFLLFLKPFFPHVCAEVHLSFSRPRPWGGMLSLLSAFLPLQMTLQLIRFRAILVFLGILAGVHSASAASVVISEVLWAGSDLQTADEWLEISAPACGSGLVTSLTGWTVTGRNSAGIETIIARFGTGQTIASGAYLVVSHWGADQSRLRDEPFTVSSEMSLLNSKLLLRLRDAQGVIVDEVDDGIGNPFAGANAKLPERKASMERSDLCAAGTDPANWRTALTIRGFDEGTLVFATPGYPNGTVDPPAEVPPVADPADVTALLYAEGTGVVLQIRWSPVTASGYRLTFDPLLPDGSSSFALPSTATGFVSHVLDPLLTYQADLVVIDENQRESDGVNILIEPYSKSENPNNSSEQYTSSSSAESSIASSLPAIAVPQFRFTELLPNPRSGQQQWVEIQHTGSGGQSLAGWSLDRGEGTTRYVFPSMDSSFVPGELRSYRRDVTNFVLARTAGFLRLVRPSGQVEDSIVYPALPQGVSVGRLPMADTAVRPFCTPTEGTSNAQDPWDARIDLQSGQLQGEEKISPNIQVLPLEPDGGTMTCQIDFGDGTILQSCNPSTHSYDQPSSYVITVSATNYCGASVRLTLSATVTVSPEEEEEQERHSSSSSSSSLSIQARSPDARFILTGVLPNPDGADGGREWIGIRNLGASGSYTDGWSLITAKTKEFQLAGLRFGSGETLRLGDAQTKLLLTNASGSVTLRDPQGEPVSVIRWTDAKPGLIYVPSRTPPGGTSATVIRVLGPDLLLVTLNREKQDRLIRIRGIAVPSALQENRENLSYFLNAYYSASALLENKNIELYFDSIYAETGSVLLAEVLLQDGRSVGDVLVSAGLAAIEDGPHGEGYQVAEEMARDSEQGIWGLSASGVSLGLPEDGSGDLLITEISAAVLTGEDEWLEIGNESDQFVSLAGWSVARPSVASAVFYLSGSTVLEPGGAILVPRSISRLALPDAGGEIELRSPLGVAIDRAVYSAAKKGRSFARMADHQWCVTSRPTPGGPNVCAALASSPRPKKAAAKKTTKKKSVLAAYVLSGTGLLEEWPADEDVPVGLPSSFSSGDILVLLGLSGAGSASAGWTLGRRRPVTASARPSPSAV